MPKCARPSEAHASMPTRGYWPYLRPGRLELNRGTDVRVCVPLFTCFLRFCPLASVHLRLSTQFLFETQGMRTTESACHLLEVVAVPVPGPGLHVNLGANLRFPRCRRGDQRPQTGGEICLCLCERLLVVEVGLKDCLIPYHDADERFDFSRQHRSRLLQD